MIPQITRRISGIVYFSLTSSISLFILILISIFSTWLLRGWLTVSGVDHRFPTNFVFQPCQQSGVCSFPYALIDLRQPYSPYDSILMPGLRYSTALRFRVSDSETNRVAGMFMVKFNFENGQGRILSTCTTSTSIPYRSNLIRMIRRLFFWPLMIFDYLQEYYTIHVQCPDPLIFSDVADDQALDLRVEIQNVKIHMVNDGWVELSGQLRGLQYYLYWWPLISTLGLFFVIFWCSTSISCGLWLVRSTGSGSKDQSITEKSINPSPSENKQFFRKGDDYSSMDDNDNFSGYDYRRPIDSDRRYSQSIGRMFGEKETDDDVQCYQRQLTNRMQNAFLDLDDSNLGS